MSDFESTMTGDVYGEGYFERGEGSNYVRYGDDPGWTPTASVMSQFLPRTSSIIEVGCAKGYFLIAARRLGFQYLRGLDISQYATDSAPSEVRDIIHHGNAVNLPWSDHKAYATCSWEFLEHVPEKELGRVLEEMDRVTMPKGWLWHRIGTLENDRDLSQHMNDHTHQTNKPTTWWRDVFDGCGYERQVAAETALNDRLRGRDWVGRFFVYRKP